MRRRLGHPSQCFVFCLQMAYSGVQLLGCLLQLVGPRLPKAQLLGKRHSPRRRLFCLLPAQRHRPRDGQKKERTRAKRGSGQGCNTVSPDRGRPTFSPYRVRPKRNMGCANTSQGSSELGRNYWENECTCVQLPLRWVQDTVPLSLSFHPPTRCSRNPPCRIHAPLCHCFFEKPASRRRDVIARA